MMAVVGGSNLQEQMRRLDPDRVDELVHAYRAHNEPLHEQLLPCSGVIDVLAELRAQGRRLGIVTAKRRETLQLGFRHVPELGAFDAIVTSDETAHDKPHPEPILLALEKLDAGPSDAAYVGDSPFDVAAARAAGVFAVAVGWGGIHRVDDADAVVEKPEELLGVL
jgi:pyrophosphatase PpaX